LERPFTLLVDKLVPLRETGQIKLLKGKGVVPQSKKHDDAGGDDVGSEEAFDFL
jgi:hypothetical protein